MPTITPQRPQIGAVVDRGQAPRLLGSHVLGRAEHHAHLGDLLAILVPIHVYVGLGHSEVEDLEQLVLTRAHDEQVGRFQIPVDDVDFMGGSQPLGRLRHQLHGLLEGEPLEPPELGVEVVAVQHLHDDEGNIVVDAVVEDLHDVGAAELSDGHGFPLEANPGLALPGQLQLHQLDRHRTPEPLVQADPHRSHAASGQLALQEIPASDDRSCAVWEHHVTSSVPPWRMDASNHPV